MREDRDVYIARILYPVEVLGPGKRIGIWFDGCTHTCDGCSNPELWERDEKYRTSYETVIQLIDGIARNNPVDGSTLTGGDPLQQPEALRELLPGLRIYSEDIILYTGYEYEYVVDEYGDIFKDISVLIDGKYIESQNKEELLRGSSNQRIMILNEDHLLKYEEYLNNSESKIQNFTTLTGTVSVGIHRPGYKEELDSILMMKGLEKNE